MCILSYVDDIEEQEWLDQQDVIVDQFHPVPTTTYNFHFKRAIVAHS